MSKHSQRLTPLSHLPGTHISDAFRRFRCTKRWSVAWYYPQPTNDMWRIFGIISLATSSISSSEKTYRLDALKAFLTQRGVALFDTCLRIRRTTGTASDKDLEVVEQADLDGMLRALSCCRAVVTAGQLATQIFTRHYGIDTKGMKMGDYREFCFEGRTIRLYRMPSSSRAYPMRTEAKAAYYERMLIDLGIKTSNEQSNL